MVVDDADPDRYERLDTVLWDNSHFTRGADMGPGPGGLSDTRLASPLVSRLLVGLTLRQLREELGLSDEQAGQAIGASVSVISNLEQGQAYFRMRDIVSLCALYGVTDQIRRVTLLGLARRANHGEWWHVYKDVVPDWFERYLALEQAASLIRSYVVEVVPGLLQTPDYARAVLADIYPTSSPQEIDRRVELRLRRQDILRRPQPPHLWVTIDEPVLRRTFGSSAVMRAQLRCLLQACDMPRVTVQVLPQRFSGRLEWGGSVAVVRLPVPQFVDVVYLERRLSGFYPEAPGELDCYRHIMNQLALQAAPANTTQDILGGMLRDN
jgi:transcriptional regulator with XRE-family HTH domain